MPSRGRALVLFAALIVLSVLVDQATKWLALAYLEPMQSLQLTGYLNLTLVFNRGAAFGFLSQQAGWQLLVFSLIAVLVVAYLTWQVVAGAWRSAMTVVAFGLIAGGALGNLIDRIRFGHVVDFIDVHYAGWHFWIFNIADSALSVGVALVLLEAVLDYRGAKTREER